jgi:hypothetical protein
MQESDFLPIPNAFDIEHYDKAEQAPSLPYQQGVLNFLCSLDLPMSRQPENSGLGES